MNEVYLLSKKGKISSTPAGVEGDKTSPEKSAI